jgi:hypothetical protein
VAVDYVDPEGCTKEWLLLLLLAILRMLVTV